MDVIATCVGFLLAESFDHVRTRHFGQITGMELDIGPVRARRYGRLAGPVMLFLGDVLKLEHAPKDIVPAHERALRGRDRIEF